MRRGRAFALLITLAVALVDAAFAQGYPSRAVRIVVPSSAGGGGDFSARLIAQLLSERLGITLN